MKTFAALTSLMALLSIQSAVGSKVILTLKGEAEVPPVVSAVTGTATIELLSDDEFKYTVNLLNPDGVKLLGAGGASIHCGEAGANGPKVAALYPQVEGGKVTSPFEFSAIMNKTDIVDPMCGDTIAVLYTYIEKGKAYVNIKSTENPSGEVRGQAPLATSAPTSSPTVSTSATPHYKFCSAFVGGVVAVVAVATM
jgi:hypothetical protein